LKSKFKKGSEKMGRKIFVSYKYWDSNVYAVPGITSGNAKVRDYVSWLEKKFTERSDNIYKGESDNEDLSDRNEDYIWSRLKDKIYDSSITIVLISPNMKEAYRWERSQWIPWEISYSIRETTRTNCTSCSNAILAVILPDRYNRYEYYNSLQLFKILSSNIKIGYIPVVKWKDFRYNCDYHINKAYQAQKDTPKYLLTKSV
jgi:antiphage defense system Thoeris ThsB-like protein